MGAFDNVRPSIIRGDIGTNAGAFSGFPPGVVFGQIHVADTRSTQAATDVQAAFAHLSSVSCVVPLAVYGGTAEQPAGADAQLVLREPGHHAGRQPDSGCAGRPERAVLPAACPAL
ncbi:MAG: hypothetical protein WKG07_16180 [Hymenobacter sp.]